MKKFLKFFYQIIILFYSFESFLLSESKMTYSKENIGENIFEIYINIIYRKSESVIFFGEKGNFYFETDFNDS